MLKVIKIIIIAFSAFFFCSFSYAENKISYIDMDFILSKSDASKSLLKQLKDILPIWFQVKLMGVK